MDQALDELLWEPVGDLALPVGQEDRPLVLATGAPLREDLEPALPVRLEDDRAGTRDGQHRDWTARPACFHGGSRVLDDVWIDPVERDDEPSSAEVRRDPAVTEIEPEQIGVGDRIGGRP